MNHRGDRLYPYLPEVGCALLLGTLLTMCLLPYLVVGAMETALSKLHLWPPVAMLILVGIFVGSLINVPLRYLQREEEQIIIVRGWSGWMNRSPLLRRSNTETIIAVNVGGCGIPVLLAMYELVVVVGHGRYVAWSVAVVTLFNILVCYYVARPVPGIGIAMPGFVSPAVAVGLSWLLLLGGEFNAIRAPVAFIAGVLGPLIGADLLHLRDVTRISVGVLSIGGAGTFDGIVLSGMVAALVA
jgi:uncharacterized membrane protein